MPDRNPLRRTGERVRSTVESLRGDGRGWVLLIVAGGWLLVLGTRVILPTLLPQVKTAFAIDNATAGVLLSVLWAAYAVTQFPAGMLSDRIGERLTLVASVLLTAAGALALALAPTFAVFVAGAVLFGLGSGLFAPPRVTVLSRTFPDRDSTALGVTFAVGNVGAAVLPLVAGGIAVVLGWRFGFGFVILPLVLVAVGLWLLLPEVDTDALAADEPGRIVSRLATEMTDRTVVVAWLAMTLTLFTYQGITAFLPTYLVATKGVTHTGAAALFGLFFASGALTQSVVGGVADRHGERGVLAAVAGFGVLTLLALPFVEGFAALALLVALLGTRLGLGPVGNGYVAAALSEEVRGSGYGLFRTFYLAVGALGSSFVGVLAGIGMFDEAFLALAVVTATSAGLYLALPAPTSSPDAGDRASEGSPDSSPTCRAVAPGSDDGEEPDTTTD